MTRSRRAVFGVLTTYASTAVMAVAGFVLVPIVMRYLNREDYGLWVMLWQAIGYVSLLEFGLGGAIVRRSAQLSVAGDPGVVNRMASTAVALYTALGLVFLIVGLIVSLLLPYWSAIPPERAGAAVAVFSLMVVYTALLFPIRVGTGILIGYQRLATANGINLLGSLLNPIVVIVLLTSGAGLLALPLGNAFAGIAVAAASVYFLWRVIPRLSIRWRYVSRAEAGELFSWSWRLFLNSLAVLVIYQTDNLVVAGGAGLAAVTTYTLTSRLPFYAMPLIFALGDSCVPGAVELCAQGKLDRLREVYLKVMRMTAALGLLCGIVVCAFNQSFVHLWVGEQNYGGTALTLLFAFILFYRVMNHVASVVIIGTGKLKGVVWMSVAEAALNLTLSLWWVRHFGLIGVAMGTAVAGVLTSGWFVIMVVCRELRISVFEYLARGVLPPLICLVPTGVATLLLTRFFPASSWLRLFIGASACVLVYGISYWFVGLGHVERKGVYGQLQRACAWLMARRQVATS